MFIEKQNHGLHLTPAGVTRPINQLFSINMQTLRILEPTYCLAPSLYLHSQQAESPAYPSPMATPWETIKKQPNGNTLGKQAKL